MISHNWSPMKRLIWLRGSGITGGAGTYETISGNPVSFTARNAPLRQLSVAFSPVQTGTGDPSPDNVRPISGWDSLNVEQRGKNLFDKDNYTSIKAYISNGAIVANNNHTLIYMPCVPNTDYTLTRKINSTDRFGAGYTEELPATDVQVYDYHFNTTVVVDGRASVTVHTGANAKYLAIWAWWAYSDATEAANTLVVELGTTATEYVPYNPSSRSISISLGSTVYSGTVDVVTGVGTVTMASVDMGSLSWGGFRFGDVYAFYVAIEGIKLNSANAICSVFSYAGNKSPANLTNNAFTTDNGSHNGYVYVRADAYADATAFKTAVTGQTLCYELATPLTIQLTPQEVESLAGDNTMWTDGDSLTVEYRSN